MMVVMVGSSSLLSATPILSMLTDWKGRETDCSSGNWNKPGDKAGEITHPGKLGLVWVNWGGVLQ